MNPDELEDLAFSGAPMPECVKTAGDVYLFLSFRALYDFAKRVRMTPEQGRKEKAQILETFRKLSMEERLREDTVALWKRIEEAASRYNKDPSVEHADQLILAIYRTPRKE